MPIRFRWDPDLIFLKNCEQDDLRTLAEILIYDTSGRRRKSLGLASNKRYRTCYNDYQSVWDVIAGELQQLGGDSMVNLLRLGHGPLYREILLDVVKKMQIKVDTSSPVETIEMSLIMKVVEDSLKKMGEEEKRKAEQEMKLVGEQMEETHSEAKLGESRSYQFAAMIANSISKHLLGREIILSEDTGLTTMKDLFSDPLDLAIKLLLPISIITGPAYQVTIPATLQVAYMRQKMLQDKSENI